MGQQATDVSEGRGRERCVPDLLHRDPAARIDVDAIADSLDFAFVSGDSNRVVERAYDEMQVGPSDWRPESYRDELFLDELVRRCMTAEHGRFEAPLRPGYLERVIATPPSDRADLELRREALTDLWEHVELRRWYNGVYRGLRAFFRTFDLQGYSSPYDSLERRLDIVRAIRDLVHLLGEAPRAGSESLARIGRFGAWIAAGEAYRDLADFLAYEEKLATVDLRIQLGSDGRIREFNILKVEENRDNRYHQGPLRRLWTRIKLFFRGYRFNETELIERWVHRVFSGTLEFLPLCVQLMADMEVLLAALTFREQCEARGLRVCLPELIEGGRTDGGVRLTRLFNPLLFAQEITPVPCDVETRRGSSMLVITGPNSGGKTRLLQAVALVQLLGQAGLYVPAEAATLRHASGMFVSLVEGAKVDQQEGRLGSEMLRIRRLFEQSNDVSVVIIDELCSGTNPSEGEEIFHLVMSLLRELRPLVLITTHFLEFAKRLQADNDLELEFLQVELDDNNRPTFGFIPGVAETSLARQTAARLGVTREELMALIERRRRAGERREAADNALDPQPSAPGADRPAPGEAEGR